VFQTFLQARRPCRICFDHRERVNRQCAAAVTTAKLVMLLIVSLRRNRRTNSTLINYNVDFSLGKDWKWKERFGAQFRFEVFNLFNHSDFAAQGSDPSKGVSGQFGCACSTPDNSNPVLGSGGPRHIQFGLKLTY